MKKIKDFIYNYNDVFVALLILVIAGAVIFWRVGVIMSYPDYMASKESGKDSPGFEAGDLLPEDVDEHLNENPEDITSNPGPGEEVGSKEGEGKEGQNPETHSEEPPKEPDGKFEIPGGSSADKVCELLIQAGYIKSREDFANAVKGKETKIKAGSFTIPAGSTVEEIVKIITK